ncbi:uncharacterized membrane protein YFL067W-like [Penaeus japonicus]|uniref:uncharacterized membrane protein YFL067W-like n=1 Tax=Penaeus japonicus TaxID=27405 RepID=UPI001C714F84|nr:uncharacterized membrane protein YFL067W-like [Penaeus japonicus]
MGMLTPHGAVAYLTLGSLCCKGVFDASGRNVAVYGLAFSVLSGIGTGINNGIDTGINNGIDTGISNGIDTGISNGIDTGISNGIDTGISNGIDTGINNGIGTGISNGIDTGINNGIGTGISNGIGTDINNGIDTGINNAIVPDEDAPFADPIVATDPKPLPCQSRCRDTKIKNVFELGFSDRPTESNIISVISLGFSVNCADIFYSSTPCGS